MGAQCIAVGRIVLPDSIFEFFPLDHAMRILHQKGQQAEEDRVEIDVFSRAMYLMRLHIEREIANLQL